MAKLYDDEETMKLRFGSLVTETRDSVKKRIPIQDFAGSILALGAYEPAPEVRDRSLLDEHSKEIKNAQTISEIFIILSAYWNYLSYEILEFIIRLTHANVWESMGKPCSCTQLIKSRIFYSKSRENPYQYCKSRENPYQVLQVTRESVSGTTSHVRCV